MTKILTPAEVAEIKARLEDADVIYFDSIPALCHTIAALRAENERLRRQLDDARRMLWLVVRAAGGRVEIHDDILADFDPARSVLEAQNRPENCTIVVKANIDAAER